MVLNDFGPDHLAILLLPVVFLHFCLAFPDTYELGMSHLGLKVLYEEFEKTPTKKIKRRLYNALV